MSRRLQTLGRKERLKSRKRIDALFQNGKKMQQFPFRLLYLIHRQADLMAARFPVQTGFTASSRNFPRAVNRNRLKRRMRETYRRKKSPLEEAALKTGTRIELFLIYTAREMTDTADMEKALTSLVGKLSREINENISLPA